MCRQNKRAVAVTTGHRGDAEQRLATEQPGHAADTGAAAAAYALKPGTVTAAVAANDAAATSIATPTAIAAS